MLIFYKINIMKPASYKKQSLDSMQSPSNFQYKSQKLKKKNIKSHIEIQKNKNKQKKKTKPHKKQISKNNAEQ